MGGPTKLGHCSSAKACCCRSACREPTDWKQSPKPTLFCVVTLNPTVTRGSFNCILISHFLLRYLELVPKNSLQTVSVGCQCFVQDVLTADCSLTRLCFRMYVFRTGGQGFLLGNWSLVLCPDTEDFATYDFKQSSSQLTSAVDKTLKSN